MTDTTSELTSRRDGHRLTITLDRAGSRNALTTALLEGIVEHARAGVSDGARVVVVQGDGPAFSAGADLGEHKNTSALPVGEQHAAYSRMSRALDDFEALPVIKLARLHGAVVGAGLVLASVCELRIADSSARFSVPEVSLGVPFSMAGFPRLVRLVGLTRATELMLTPTTMDAAEAERAGLVTRVVDPQDLDRVVDEVAAHVASLPSLLVADAVDRIRKAGAGLVPTPEVDVSGLALASADPECQRASAVYTARVARKSDSPEVHR